MRQFILSILVLIMATATCAAQSRTNYYNQYGNSLESSTTSRNYSEGTTTNYYNQYGSNTGSASTRSNYGGGYTANYYDQYGSRIGSSSDW